MSSVYPYRYLSLVMCQTVLVIFFVSHMVLIRMLKFFYYYVFHILSDRLIALTSTKSLVKH